MAWTSASFSISSGVPCFSRRPLCRIVTRSTTRSAMSRSCSISTYPIWGGGPGARLAKQTRRGPPRQRHADLELTELAVRQFRDQPLGQVREAGAFEQVLGRDARGMAGARPDETEAAAADAAGRQKKIVPD